MYLFRRRSLANRGARHIKFFSALQGTTESFAKLNPVLASRILI
jgi:hypothetical protein